MNDEQMLLAFVQDRDAACPACGYNVRNLASPRCPECGRELRLTVGVVEPYLKPYITLVVILCGSAGIGLFCLLICLKEGWPPLGTGFNITFLFHMLMIPVAIVAVAQRRRFMRFDRQTQWRITIFAGAVCASILAAFMTFVR